MTGLVRAAQLVAAVCLALVVSGCVAGPNASEAPASAIPSGSLAPSPSASPEAQPLRDTGSTSILAPGTYVLDQFPVDLTFDIPAGEGPGWHVGKSTAHNANLLWNTPPEISVALGFWSVDNVYLDRCDVAAGERDPPIGPSVDDLVAALSSLPWFDASGPVDATVGAFHGKQIDLTALDSGDGCEDILMWNGGNEHAAQSPGETDRLLILDVDGVRVVLVPIVEQPDAVAEAQLQEILDSIRTDPSS